MEETGDVTSGFISQVLASCILTNPFFNIQYLLKCVHLNSTLFMLFLCCAEQNKQKRDFILIYTGIIEEKMLWIPKTQMECNMLQDWCEKFPWTFFCLRTGSLLETIVKSHKFNTCHFSAKKQTANVSEAPFQPAGGKCLIFKTSAFFGGTFL